MLDRASMPRESSRVRRTATTTLWISYLLFWVGGVVSYLLLGGPPKGSEWAAPAFLWIGAALMVVQFDPPTALRIALAGWAGWASEWIGIHTGFPFGRYDYTDALGPAVAGAPLAMIPAWILLAGYARAIVGPLRICNPWAAAILGACWMTAVDLVIDPLAAGPLGYWHWAEPGFYFGIPATNFLGWFAVSTLLLRGIGPSAPAFRGAAKTGASIVIFFSVIAIHSDGVRPVAAIGLILLGLQTLLSHRIASRAPPASSIVHPR